MKKLYIFSSINTIFITFNLLLVGMESFEISFATSFTNIRLIRSARYIPNFTQSRFRLRDFGQSFMLRKLTGILTKGVIPDSNWRCLLLLILRHKRVPSTSRNNDTIYNLIFEEEVRLELTSRLSSTLQFSRLLH